MEKQTVVLVDRSGEVLDRVVNTLDVQTVQGSGSSPMVLELAGIGDASMLIAATNSDDTNMVACLMARHLGPPDMVRIARVRDPMLSRSDRIRDSLGIDLVIHPEELASQRIRYILQTPGALDSVPLVEGELDLVAALVAEDSPMAGHTLADLPGVIGERLHVTALARDGEMIIPRGKTRVLAGDVAYAVARRKGVPSLFAHTGSDLSPARKITIAGGDGLGYHLASVLEMVDDISVKVIEADEDRCRYLSERLRRTLVLNGDPTDLSLFREEFVGESDAFVAAGMDDETNILSSLLAARLGIARVITVVHRSSHMPLIKAVGIKCVISPRLIAAGSILHFMRRGKVSKVSIVGEDTELTEYLVTEKSRIAGKMLQEAGIPPEALVCAVVRGEDVILPEGANSLLPGDRAIVIARRATGAKLDRLFGPRTGLLEVLKA